MVFKTIVIQAERPIDIDTEIRFDIATARAEDVELLRFDINKREDSWQKIQNAAIKVLKKMKSASQIQFIATQLSFANSNAEAEFLINKYPQYIDNVSEKGDGEAYVFVKL